MTNTKDMFCFQCEQTVGCTACMGAAGTCGIRPISTPEADLAQIMG